MKLYRYLKEEELKKIQAGEIESVGFFYNDTERYRKVNNHKYKQNTKYMHFYFSKKEIRRIKAQKFLGAALFYVCEFDVPLYVILPHIGYGIYESRGYITPYDKVYEVALPAQKMKQKYFINSELDEESGPNGFGDLAKYKKPLLESEENEVEFEK